MAFLTDRTLSTGLTANDLIHIVNTGDTSQNPAGSSYKATMGQVIDLINPTTITGGTYDPITGTITFYDDTGGSFNVTGLVTGYTNTAVTAFTYNNTNTFTVFENDGTTHSATFDIITGLTINGNLNVTGTTSSGVISATTYQNLPIDIRVTGGTYSSGTTTFTNNTGGTFSVSGFTTPFTGNTSATCITDIYVTNVNSCSPLHIQPINSGDVFISETGGSVGIGTTIIDGSNPEALVVSGINTTSYNLLIGRARVNNYAQLNIVNKSSGTSSSADVVATNDTGTELTNFIDMGINGSNFSGGLIGGANDAYLYSTGRELYIGNATTGLTSNIKFFVGDAALGVDMIISGSTGFIGVGTTTPTSRLDVSGKTRTTSLQITSGATNGYVLLSDGSGNATWSPQSNITGNTNTFVTGFTYNNANTITLSQNNGQSSGVTINSVTGLTINGNLSVTGTTSSGTISATTYQNLPTDIRVTGATYSNNTFTYTNNTGGTFSVLFNTMTGLTINGNLNVTGTIFSTGSTQFISTTGITISAVTLSTGTTYNGINYAGNVNLTIPSPSGFTGLKIIIKDESGNAGTYRIRLTPSVGTIDGNSYVDMNINYMSLTLVARNNNWWII
jgi:hypothetical protein